MNSACVVAFAFAITIRLVSPFMKTAARKTTLKHRYHLIESGSGSQRRVDKERGIIHDVFLIGNRSSNNRFYPPETLREAAPLYESAPVNCDHPDDPDAPRSVRDRLGVIRNVRVTENGLRGDLHLIRSHPMADSVLESAINPALHKVWGFSHNADGECDVEGGKTIVRRVTELRSLDLVSDPATTQGLFESVQRTKKSAVESVAPARVRRGESIRRKHRKGNIAMRQTLKEWWVRTKPKLLKPAQKTVQRLFESGYMDEDAPMMEDDVESTMGADPSSDPAGEDVDPESALRAGFRSAMVAVLDDGTMDGKAKVARIKELIMTAERLMASGQEVPEQDEEVDAAVDGDEEVMEYDEEEGELLENEDCDEDEVMEGEASDSPFPATKMPAAVKNAKKVPESKQSLRRKVAYLQREKRSARLCRENGVECTAPLLEALTKLNSDAKRLALLESLKSPRRARNTSPLTEGRGGSNSNGDMSTEDFVKAITTVAG